MTTRDMTEREFKAALKRNGLKLVLMWIWRANPTDDQVNMGVGVVSYRKTGVHFRESIAYALRRFREADAEAARKRKEAKQ